MANRNARSVSTFRCWDGASPPLSLSDICVVGESHHDNPRAAKRRVLLDPARVPRGARRVVLLQAHTVSAKFGKKLLAREPRELWLVGDSQAFAHPEHWFLQMCALHGSTCLQPAPPAPWCAVAETLSEALRATENAGAVRILAATRNEKEQVMQHLRGGANVVRRGDPVYLWKARKRVLVREIYGGNGRVLDEIDLNSAPAAARVLTRTAGRVRPSELNAALVDTPRTFGASTPSCTLVLPGVRPEVARMAAQCTRQAVIGVGRAPF